MAMNLVAPGGDPLAAEVQVALEVLVVTGVPTLLFGVIAGLAHRRMDVTRFRVTLAVPMAVFSWPLITASTPEPLIFQVVAQLAFVWLTPAPLIPENWKAQP
ncbi:hypothetical protein ACFU5O_32265 [Streptomyces sp. NPDC057445]|uniref:hypothetical protein n=1 Tax=Streptomyces sp. NPDC057445 TaxID=3346136 RepID=UPI00367D6D59